MASAAAAAAEVKKLIYESLAKAEETCTTPTVFNYSIPLPGTSLILHKIFMICGGSMGIVSIAIAIYLLADHLRYYTKPKEQHQYLRIIFFIPFLTITNFLALVFPDSAGWIQPIGDYYESFAISALYMLYCQIILSEDEKVGDEVTLVNVKRALAAEHAGQGHNLGWLRTSWFLVFQIAISRVATLIANEIIFGVTCPLDPARHDAATALQVFQGICTGMAIIGVIMLERRTRKSFLKGEKPTFKFFSFKAIIALQALQQIIFTILTVTRILFPAPPFYVSYNDYAKGMPTLIFLLEMLCVSIMFLWSFNFDRYKAEFKSGKKRAQSPSMAILSSLIPVDVFKALISGFKSGRFEQEHSVSKFKPVKFERDYSDS